MVYHKCAEESLPGFISAETNKSIKLIQDFKDDGSMKFNIEKNAHPSLGLFATVILDPPTLKRRKLSGTVQLTLKIYLPSVRLANDIDSIIFLSCF